MTNRQTVPASISPLNPDEFAALQQLGKSFSRNTIAAAVLSRLKAFGYVRELLGLIIITDTGSSRLAQGRQ